MASTDKRYYWIKLKRDFFRRHDVQILGRMNNGHEFQLFYLKLLCESVDHEGRLRFSDDLPYTPSMLAALCEVSEGLANDALEALEKLNLIEKLEDGTYYLPSVGDMFGHETYWAQRKREKRQEALDMEGTEVGQELDTVGHCPTCQGKSIEYRDIKPLSNDKGIESTTPKQVLELYAQICNSFPAVKVLSENRKNAIKARLNIYSLEDFKRLFEKAEASSFLKGANDRNWAATFDWLIKDANMAKVLEGNYDDKPKRGGASKKNAFNEIEHNEYDFDDLERKLISN